MTDQVPTPEPFSPPSEKYNERRGRGGLPSGSLTAGLILILLGGAFMLQNLGFVRFGYLHNWWALFILIPAVASFERAYRTFRFEGNRLTASARGSLFGGVLITLVAATFLFNLSWLWIGPCLIILLGLLVLSNAFDPEKI